MYAVHPFLFLLHLLCLRFLTLNEPYFSRFRSYLACILPSGLIIYVSATLQPYHAAYSAGLISHQKGCVNPAQAAEIHSILGKCVLLNKLFLQGCALKGTTALLRLISQFEGSGKQAVHAMPYQEAMSAMPACLHSSPLLSFTFLVTFPEERPPLPSADVPEIVTATSITFPPSLQVPKTNPQFFASSCLHAALPSFHSYFRLASCLMCVTAKGPPGILYA